MILKIKSVKHGTFKVILDDDIDSSFIKNKLCIAKSDKVNNYFKVVTRYKEKTRTLARLIAEAKSGELVDHINGNPLDNRKCNLRICGHSGNSQNCKKPKSNTSGYKGVSWCKYRKKYRAYYTLKNRFIWIGYFLDKKEAAKAYNREVVKHFGNFAKLNQI